MLKIKTKILGAGLILPSVLIILLLIAWFLRWEQGPTQNIAGLKIEHLRDRWTGQSWIKLYGKLDKSDDGLELAKNIANNTSLTLDKKERFYSGELYPYFDDSIINKRYKELSKTEGAAKKNELENKVSQVLKTQEQYAEFHSQYEVIYKIAKDEYWEKHKPQTDSRGEEWARFYFELSPPDEFQDYFETQVPNDILEGHNKWVELSNLENNLKKEIKKIPVQVNDNAKNTLNIDAIKNRKIATNIWVALLMTNIIITTFFIYRNQQQKKNQQKESTVEGEHIENNKRIFN